jgi:flavin-dependent dehydrogenase
MRFRTILSLATLFMACFTLAVFAQPMPANAAGLGESRAPENQSVSGQIASVGDAAFTVNVAKGKQGAPAVEFLVDDKTKVEGKLTIGAQALVEYRSDSGKNIAVHVVVTPASGINPY